MLQNYKQRVIPAKAGIQCVICGALWASWIPAFGPVDLIDYNSKYSRNSRD